MLSSNACMPTGAGKCRDPGRSKPKVLTPPVRREVIEQLMQIRLSIMRACQIADLSRAAYHKRPALVSRNEILK